MNRLAQIAARGAEIEVELRKEGADIDALEKELKSLAEEREEIVRETERRALLDKLAGESTMDVVSSVPNDGEKRCYGADSPEYRSAFFAQLLDRELTPEQRAAYQHTTANSGAVLPTTTLDQIWDLVSDKHSIMGDITVYRTGTVIDVIKHSEIVAGKAKKVAEATANDDEKNTFVTVKLSGNDFSKHVDISYAMREMSIDSFESYLINEIVNEIGRALAEDVISTVKTQVNSANKIAVTGVTKFTDITKAFGQLKRVSNVVVYCNFSTLYNQLVSMTDDTKRPIYQPTLQDGAMGVLLGGTVHIEDALADGEILIGDPQRIVYNMVTDIMVEADKDIKKHVWTYAGYCRGEGALIDDKSFTLITVTPGG